jgi:hypothetical protein
VLLVQRHRVRYHYIKTPKITKNEGRCTFGKACSKSSCISSPFRVQLFDTAFNISPVKYACCQNGGPTIQRQFDFVGNTLLLHSESSNHSNDHQKTFVNSFRISFELVLPLMCVADPPCSTAQTFQTSPVYSDFSCPACSNSWLRC